MNYDRPRQVTQEGRPDTGKWRWTTANDGRAWASGGCSDCDGHDTSDEAAEHHRDYRRRIAEFHVIPDDKADALRRCEVEGCGTFTASVLTIPYEIFQVNVCPAHHTGETRERLIGIVTERWHS